MFYLNKQKCLLSTLIAESSGGEYKPLANGPVASSSEPVCYVSRFINVSNSIFSISIMNNTRKSQMYCVQLSVLQNIYWKELALLLFVWISFLGIQIVKVKTTIDYNIKSCE